MAESMSEIMNPGAVQRDPDFPDAPLQWARESAIEAAQADGIDLTNEHWETIAALQSYFARNEQPKVRDLHDALEEHFHAKGGLKFLYEIFPGGPVAQGCRYAGLEAPAGVVDQSFGSVQ